MGFRDSGFGGKRTPNNGFGLSAFVECEARRGFVILGLRWKMEWPLYIFLLVPDKTIYVFKYSSIEPQLFPGHNDSFG